MSNKICLNASFIKETFMTNFDLDYSDIREIFKEKLKIDNITKKISTIFQNERYKNKIDYQPYFQRNYVWDDEKATYFIESILLGTDIPPLVFFDSKNKIEVIDGRQRFETIERFLSDKFALKSNGLHALKSLAGKKYSQLDDYVEIFEETRIRILQFSVVNEPKLDPEKEDKIKKEIFRRYNSGITSLTKEEIDRADYIDDKFTILIKDKLCNNEEFYQLLCNTILPKSKRNFSLRDKINILCTRVRMLATLPYVPIYNYAHCSSKQDIINTYFYKYIAPAERYNQEYNKLLDTVKHLEQFYSICKRWNSDLLNNQLFFETLFWGINILLSSGVSIDNKKSNDIISYIFNLNTNSNIWDNFDNIAEKSIFSIFEKTGSHYYSAVNNRYKFISLVFNEFYSVDFSKRLKDNSKHKEVLEGKGSDDDLLDKYRLSKGLPETLSIEDIISDMNKDRFLVRPPYQRSEVKNNSKASYLMESILLGINIPPLFVFKRPDKIKEVIDGQQRILTILGFLGKSYKDENGKTVFSQKNKFKLSKLKILEDLNGKNKDDLDSDFIDAILDFRIDVIEIDSSINPNFSQIDLFLRLNTKPYPIKDNTFEMWNAYLDRELLEKVKDITNKYEKKVFRPKNNRMKVEELVTTLAYLDYKLKQPHSEILNVLNIYVKDNKICSRIMNKNQVTKLLGDVSDKNSDEFFKSIDSVEIFSKKIIILIDSNSDKLRLLFQHTKKGTQYKTDQNFYFLWMMLRNISLEKIEKNKINYFSKISNMYKKIQNAPQNYQIQDFLREINDFM